MEEAAEEVAVEAGNRIVHKGNGSSMAKLFAIGKYFSGMPVNILK